MQITFRAIDSSEIGRAHKWHEDFAAANEALYPRTASHFLELAMDRCVWGAVSSDDEYLAMSYANFDDDKNEWEIGGLMVTPDARGKNLGSIMMRLPLAHMLFTENPLALDPAPTIVTHVLHGNDHPRRIIPSVGFEFSHDVTIPGSAMPGMKTDDDGNVRGDEFHLKVPDALIQLAEWAEKWDGKLRDGTSARIDLFHGYSLDLWASAFRDMATMTASDHGRAGIAEN